MSEIGEGKQEQRSVDPGQLSPGVEAVINKKVESGEVKPTSPQELASLTTKLLIGHEVLAQNNIPSERREQVSADLKKTISEIKEILNQSQNSEEIDEMAREIVQNWRERGVLNTIHPISLMFSGLNEYKKQ